MSEHNIIERINVYFGDMSIVDNRLFYSTWKKHIRYFDSIAGTSFFDIRTTLGEICHDYNR